MKSRSAAKNFSLHIEIVNRDKKVDDFLIPTIVFQLITQLLGEFLRKTILLERKARGARRSTMLNNVQHGGFYENIISYCRYLGSYRSFRTGKRGLFKCLGFL